MFCAKCGNEVSEEVKFCPNCGQPKEGAESYSQPEQYTNQTPYNGQTVYNGQSQYSGQGNGQGQYNNGYNQHQSYNQGAYNPMTEQKSKVVAGLLQLFLGGFGAGRFYLGYTGIGVAQLLVTLFTCGIGGLWPFIDGILILCGQVPNDANGIPLKD